MICDADAVIELELERLRLLKQRRHGERTNSHLATPAIRMLIGDWHIDELGYVRERSPRATSGACGQFFLIWTQPSRRRGN
jgi:hypothetical protein